MNDNKKGNNPKAKRYNQRLLKTTLLYKTPRETSSALPLPVSGGLGEGVGRAPLQKRVLSPREVPTQWVA